MFGFSREGGRGPLILATLKSVVLIAGISYAAAHWLSSSKLDRGGLGQLAFDAGRLDPTTTGSLGGRAAGTRLDPCALPPR